MKGLIVLGLGLWSVSAALPPALAASSGPQLEKVVLVMRHGVRVPGKISAEAVTDPCAYAAQPWPAWRNPGDDEDLGEDCLTAHGQTLAERLGAYYRLLYVHELGFLPEVCDAAKPLVYLHADYIQREVKTSEGLLAGFFPGCEIPIHTVKSGTPTCTEKSPDTLFHPPKGCALTPEEKKAMILRQVGDPGALTAMYRGPLEEIQKVLGCCREAACPGATASSSPCATKAGACTIFDLPVSFDKKGGLTGAFHVGSTVAEAFLLERANGMPADQVGWGKVDDELLRKILPVHTASHQIDSGYPTAARAGGSNLLAHVLADLEQTVTGKAVPGAMSPARARMVVYVGHDTNFDYLGGLLDLTWQSPGFLPNQAPPAGGLFFELYRDPASRAVTVRASYTSQTLEQMADASELTLANPPNRVPVTIPGCAGSAGAAGENECTYAAFRALVEKAIDTACVSSDLRLFKPEEGDANARAGS